MGFIAGRKRVAWVYTGIAAVTASGVPAPAWADAAQICKSDDDDEDSKPQPAWKQFAVAGACVELSGTASFIYQKILDSQGNQIPVFSTLRGPVFRPGILSGQGLFDTQSEPASQPNHLNTADFSVRFDTTRKTAAGDLTTGFEVQYEKTSDDAGNGVLTLTEGVVSWAGLKAGYTDSLMNFWSGDFQFSATAPSRTVATASYDFKFNEAWTLTVAGETGVPTTRAGASSFAPVYWDDPVIAARLRYETDDLTAQVSAMHHELQFGGDNPILARFGRGQEQRMSGWAASFGLTKPLPKISDGSEFSMQATYAVNASSYLGTTGDLSAFSALLPVPGETRGWSVVGSYHHVWSEHWEANVMASHLALDITLAHLASTADSTRYAANLIWKPVKNVQIGGELGWVDFTLRPDGAPGFFPVVSGSALVSYLFVTWTF
jgi:hypothetical protein